MMPEVDDEMFQTPAHNQGEDDFSEFQCIYQNKY